MNNYIWIMLWYINLFRSLWSFRRQKLLKMMFALFHKKPQRIGRCLKNHFPSNSFRHCVFPTLKENKQHCLKIKTNFVTYVRFFNLRQFGAESYFCFSLETMWLRKQGTCVNTYCSSHLLNGTRPDKPHSKRFIHKLEVRFRGNVQHNCGLFKFRGSLVFRL